MRLEQPVQCDECDAATSPNKIHLHSTEDDSDSSTSFSCSISQARRRIRKACTTKQLKRRLPVLQWIRRCTFQSVLYDFLAGFTVALTAIPQGIAYAAVAGLPLEYGLYTAFGGPFAYVLFGSVYQITVGPTVVMAIMTLPYVQKGGIKYANMLSFLTGCVELLAGLFNLGFLMNFFSGPVISGFSFAAATTIILVQIKGLLGLKFPGSAFSQIFPGLFTHYQDIRLWDTVLGISFIVFLIILKNLNEFKKCFPSASFLHKPFVCRTLWFISTCRNALAVILGCTCGYIFYLYGYTPFNLTGEIKSGIPTFQFPSFGFERSVYPIVPLNSTDIVSNVTSEWVSFGDILWDFGFGFVLVPAIAILEQIAIAKAFSGGGKTDSTQEMIAIGMGSIFSSFFGCLPQTASFARSSVLSASGGQTQLANLFNGGVILLALAFLMPTFYFIPKSVLGAVIITAVYPLIEFHEILSMWKGRRIELIPFLLTFFCCLFINMEYGILIGAQVHILLLAYSATRSKSEFIREEDMVEKQLVIKVDRSLYFPSAERFRDVLGKATFKLNDENGVIVIDFSQVAEIDHTSLKMLKSMLSSWDENGGKYSFINVNPKVRQSLLYVLPASVVFA